MKRIDLRRVTFTDNALERWAERIGLPAWQFRPTLLQAVPAHRRLRRRGREAYKSGRWPGPTRVYVERTVGVVFVIARDPDRVVTVLPLWACRMGGDVVEVEVEVEREGEPCLSN